MSKKQKLLDKLKARSKSVTFDEAESLLLSLGFTKSNKGKTSGSKIKFKTGDVPIELHKPHPQKELKLYQTNKIHEILTREGFI